MSLELTEQLGISYESEASASYLILSISSSEAVFDYQVEMIRSNSISGILPLDMRQKDETLCFYYNITSKLSLSQFLKHRKLKRNQFIGIITAITRTLLDCRGYLLYERCIIMDTDYIYISPDTLQISMAYLPVEFNVDVNGRFKDFMVNLIIHSADIDDNESDNFLQRIINCLKMDTFSIEGFYKLLIELAQAKVASADDKLANDNAISSVQQGSEFANVKIKKDRISTKDSEPDGCLLPPVLKLQDSVEKAGKGDGKAVNKRERIAFIVGAALLQIIFILLIIFGRSSISSLNSDTASVYIGIGVVEVGINALIFKKLRSIKPVKVAEKGGQKPLIQIPKPANIPKEEKWSMTGHLNEVYGLAFGTGGAGKPGAGEVNRGKEEENIWKMQPDCSLQPPVPGEDRPAEKRGETVLLDISGEKYPYLQPVGNGEARKILITKNDFLIGRLREQVDHTVENNAVGKVHAQISCAGSGTYYIKDLNSRNGTFVNNQRIKSNEEYEIKSGDRITLANSDFIFVNPVI